MRISQVKTVVSPTFGSQAAAATSSSGMATPPVRKTRTSPTQGKAAPIAVPSAANSRLTQAGPATSLLQTPNTFKYEQNLYPPKTTTIPRAGITLSTAGVATSAKPSSGNWAAESATSTTPPPNASLKQVPQTGDALPNIIVHDTADPRLITAAPVVYKQRLYSAPLDNAMAHTTPATIGGNKPVQPGTDSQESISKRLAAFPVPPEAIAEIHSLPPALPCRPAASRQPIRGSLSPHTQRVALTRPPGCKGAHIKMLKAGMPPLKAIGSP